MCAIVRVVFFVFLFFVFVFLFFVLFFSPRLSLFLLYFLIAVVAAFVLMLKFFLFFLFNVPGGVPESALIKHFFLGYTIRRCMQMRGYEYKLYVDCGGELADRISIHQFCFTLRLQFCHLFQTVVCFISPDITLCG